MLQLNVSQASTICRASGRAMRSLGIWLRQSAFCKLKKTFLFLGPEKKIRKLRFISKLVIYLRRFFNSKRFVDLFSK